MRFSIVTVTFNDLAGLRVTRASVRAQTFRDFEWLVMDGGSTDGTPDALREWQSEIRAAVSAPDKGPYDAMNKGLALACGEYVLFINAGDALAAPDTLQNLHDAIGADAPDFIYGDSLEEQRSGVVFYKKARPHHCRWWGMFTHHQAMAYRTAFLKTVSPAYDLRWRVGADLDLTWRILNRTKNIMRVHFPSRGLRPLEFPRPMRRSARTTHDAPRTFAYADGIKCGDYVRANLRVDAAAKTACVL